MAGSHSGRLASLGRMRQIAFRGLISPWSLKFRLKVDVETPAASASVLTLMESEQGCVNYVQGSHRYGMRAHGCSGT